MVNDRVNAVVNVMVNHMTHGTSHWKMKITALLIAQFGPLFNYWQ